MKNTFLILWSLCSLLACSENKKKTVEQPSSKYEEVLRQFPVIQQSGKYNVLTVGTFHFDRSMDGSDVIAKNHIDISSTENQELLDSLIKVLKVYNPTHIAVEWKPKYQSYLDSLYQNYQKGRYQLGKNETFQIGFKLAHQLGLNRLYCVDNNPPMPETVNAIDDLEEYAEEKGHSDLWHKFDQDNQYYLTFVDTIQRNLNVLDYLKVMNSSANINRTKQLWTTGLINVGYGDKYIGADLLGRWYRRNARIYANAKNLVSSEGDKLLIIYGNAHKWILDELFLSSPDFEVLQLNDLI